MQAGKKVPLGMKRSGSGGALKRSPRHTQKNEKVEAQLSLKNSELIKAACEEKISSNLSA